MRKAEGKIYSSHMPKELVAELYCSSSPASRARGGGLPGPRWSPAALSKVGRMEWKTSGGGGLRTESPARGGGWTSEGSAYQGPGGEVWAAPEPSEAEECLDARPAIG